MTHSTDPEGTAAEDSSGDVPPASGYPTPTAAQYEPAPYEPPVETQLTWTPVAEPPAAPESESWPFGQDEQSDTYLPPAPPSAEAGYQQAPAPPVEPGYPADPGAAPAAVQYGPPPGQYEFPPQYAEPRPDQYPPPQEYPPPQPFEQSQQGYAPSAPQPSVEQSPGYAPPQQSFDQPQHGYAPPQPSFDQSPQGYAPPQHPAEAAPPYPVEPNAHAHPAPPSAAPPRPEDLLVPNRAPLTAAPASWGWRGRVNRGSGGLIKPKAAPAEIAVRQAIRDIQHGFSRPMTVVVIQPKGGAGKTPTTICLSAAFGAYRGGYVVGWDDNETRGTLAVRVSNPDSRRETVWDLLGDLAAFERFDARVGDLSFYVRSQPDAHFDALVSDDNPANMAQIGEDEFHRLHKVLQRFYRMIVVDTGNNVRSPNWQAAVNAADLVVVVSTYQRDVGYSASWVLDHLAQTGREELARNAVTVLTAADPSTDKEVREQLLAHFGARTRAVAEIPYDRQISYGGPIRWASLEEPTRNAWILAGATIVNALAEQDQRAHEAR